MASRFVTHTEAADSIASLGSEFVVVENPGYIHPPREVYPLAPKRTTLTRGVAGVVMDMDGTTTTTEALCIHSLETMVRRITNRESNTVWEGLDRQRDYPHIIGNSTTKHVEYLVHTYADSIDPEAYRRHYVRAAAWTLGHAADEGRRAEVAANLSAFGLGHLVNDPRFQALQRSRDFSSADDHATISALASESASALDVADMNRVVRAAIDIYYHRYHEILSELDAGGGATLAADILGDSSRGIIEPMPGIDVCLALVKGWLGERASLLAPQLQNYLQGLGIEGGERSRLAALGRYFTTYPCRVAVVTSSIRYEARIVLAEVFRVIRLGIAGWPVPGELRADLDARFADFESYYDAFITASDSSEIRLKPHRDLYSIALHRMGIVPADFDRIVGFEDSESGTIAIRAAGIGLCCAVPFAETHGHVFTAASHVAYGGLPEVLLKHGLFLPLDVVN